MIARIRGTVIEKTADTVVIDVSGVGYELWVSLRDLDTLPAVGEEATVHVHTHVREDALLLFGFAVKGDKLLYQRLTSVSGIGPKSALAALGALSGEAIQQAILTGDQRTLCKIPGVGKKTAQRIILELSEKVAGLDLSPPITKKGTPLDDLFLALINLGYQRKDAGEMVSRLRPDADAGATSATLLKRALALLR